jgi:hypothetical protein
VRYSPFQAGGYQLQPAISITARLPCSLLGFMVITTVLAASFGRIGEVYGRIKVFTKREN